MTMTRTRVFAVSAALLLAAGSAHAQRWGGSPVAASSRQASSTESRPAAPSASNGFPSQWGGSPAGRRSHENRRAGFVIPTDAFIPMAAEVPAPVAARAVVDTVFTQVVLAPVQMQVITAPHEERQLTTMEVYRQQRFHNP